MQASAEPKPQTPADIINARGFWDDIPNAPNQATPAQVAALRARQALAAATDPQPTASVSESFNKAMAYAPAAASPVDRANVVAASAPIPPRPARPARNAGAAATEINTVVAKGAQGQDSRGRDLDPACRRQGQRYLDARGDAGAEREPCDVDDRAWRHRDDPDARATSSSRRP